MKTILQVDDEPGILKLVATMLTGSGYHVLTADSGEHAIRLFKSNPTDVVAPGMSGPMIADQIAALKPEIKVLFMSRRLVVEKGYSLLIKPFTMEELGRKIDSVLAGEVS